MTTFCRVVPGLPGAALGTEPGTPPDRKIRRCGFNDYRERRLAASNQKVRDEEVFTKDCYCCGGGARVALPSITVAQAPLEVCTSDLKV